MFVIRRSSVVGQKMRVSPKPGPARGPIVVRPFDGSHADAEGVLRVERATFDESPYAPEQLQAMLAEGPQRAWVAVHGSTVAGFVIAFLTTGLHGPCWEIDLLAVHPDWRGRRLGSQLIAAAADYGAGLACRARAVTADDNLASLQAFGRIGFSLEPGAFSLLIQRPGEVAQPEPDRPGARARRRLGVTVRQSTGAEVAKWLASLSLRQGAPTADLAPPGSVDHIGRPGPGVTLLVAEQNGQPIGYAELIEVQTLLYHGVWIESLLALTRPACAALVEHAMQQVRGAGLDEIGAIAPELNGPLQQSLLTAGFRSLGKFRWLTAQLPLVPPATHSHPPSSHREKADSDRG